MAVTYQTNYNAYPNITITNGGAATGTITSTSGAGYTIATGAGINGTYSVGYTTPSANFTNSNGKTLMSVPHGGENIVLEEAATLEVKGNVKINGIDLEERLKTIEKLLNIPQRDVIMESKYPKLKKLYDEYMHELEKYTTWERVKGENK